MGSLLTILFGLAVVVVAPLSGAPSRPGQPEHARAAFSPRPRHGLGHHRQAVQAGRPGFRFAYLLSIPQHPKATR
jgi:hypothetical protein